MVGYIALPGHSFLVVDRRCGIPHCLSGREDYPAPVSGGGARHLPIEYTSSKSKAGINSLTLSSFHTAIASFRRCRKLVLVLVQDDTADIVAAWSRTRLS